LPFQHRVIQLGCERVYLDTCCLSRLLDDWTGRRVLEEAMAVRRALKRIASGEWAWAGNDALVDEIAARPDTSGREFLLELLASATTWVRLDEDVTTRGERRQGTGLGAYGNAYGIDSYGWVVRHEDRHRVNGITWWGAEHLDHTVTDDDHDGIPTSVLRMNYSMTEYQPGVDVGHLAGYNPFLKSSVPDDTRYGSDVTDNEDYTMHTQEHWSNSVCGTVQQDRSYAGKQWDNPPTKAEIPDHVVGCP
jgi:hypothetical protein